MFEKDDKLERIEDLKKRLFSRDVKLMPKKRVGSLHSTDYGIQKNWGFTEKEKNMKASNSKLGFSIFKKFFIFSIFFLLISGLFAIYKLYSGTGSISTKNVEIEIIGNSFTSGGDDFSIGVDVTNNNKAAIEFSDLLIEYPKGSSGAQSGDFERIRKPIGTISAGATASSDFKIVLFGEQGSVQNLKVTLEYRVEGSNAIFVKEQEYPVNISSSPVTIFVDSPVTINSGHEIILNVKVVLAGSKISPNMRLKVDYPTGFQFGSSSINPIFGQNFWDLGDLAPGFEKNISIKGTMFGVEKDVSSFRFYVGPEKTADQSDIGIVYNSFIQTITITKPFLEASMTIYDEDKVEYSVGAQNLVTSKIIWSNNLPTRVSDVEISVQISGNAIDLGSIQASGGFYDSLTNKIIWNKNTIKDLANVEPGSNGVLDLAFSSLSIFSKNQSLINDPKIFFDVTISGNQENGSNINQTVSNSVKKLVKINSDLRITGKALYNSGTFKNTGPMPPKAGQSTTYTIEWSVTNSSNNVSNAVVKASLPIYIKLLGVTFPTSSDITYDDFSKVITWNIGAVSKGTGFTEDAKKVSFQIEMTPFISQIGSNLPMISDIVLSGLDLFTNSTLSSKINYLNMSLVNDKGFITSNDRVSP